MIQAFFAAVMKKKITGFLLAVLLTACAGKQDGNGTATDCSSLQKGALLAADSMRVSEEKLNDFYFSVRLLATGIKGNYDVLAAYGPNDGNGRLVMPRGGEGLCPVLRPGPETYSYEIGFRQGNDSTFYPYFSVSWQEGQLLMRYTAAYSFE